MGGTNLNTNVSGLFKRHEYWFETNQDGLFEFYSFKNYDSVFLTEKDVPENFSGCCLLSDEARLCWYVNGKLHRINDPTVCDAGGWYAYHDFYLNDKHYTEEEYWRHPTMIGYKLKNILNL